MVISLFNVKRKWLSNCLKMDSEPKHAKSIFKKNLIAINYYLSAKCDARKNLVLHSSLKKGVFNEVYKIILGMDMSQNEKPPGIGAHIQNICQKQTFQMYSIF